MGKKGISKEKKSMCDSAIIVGAHLVLGDGTKRPRLAKTKKCVRPVSIRFTTDMAPIVGHLLDIQGRLTPKQRDMLHSVNATHC